jgi:hypothetical protein
MAAELKTYGIRMCASQCTIDSHAHVELDWGAGVLQIITQKGQSLDAAYLMPGYTSVVDMTAHHLADWTYQCDAQARLVYSA